MSELREQDAAADWTDDERQRIGDADELLVSSRRPDGTDRPFIRIWAVRAGEDLYIRSAYGTDNPWYRRALRSGRGRIKAGGVERAVTFTHIDPADAGIQEAVDAAYHAKYDRYPPRIVATVVGTAAHETTLRIDPLAD